MRRRTLILAAPAVVLVVAVYVALPPAARVAAPPLDNPRVVRGALHVHTERSDGTGTVERVADAARRAGLQFVVLADHGDATRTPDPPAYRGGVLCIDAVEISTTAGHYVVLGLGRAPYRLAGEPRDVVEDVRRLGGFGIAAHPASPKAELQWGAWDAPFDGLEWLNADSEWRDEPMPAIVRALATYLFRPPETIASLFDRPAEVLSRWDALNRERRVVGIAGHDAHARIGLRGNWEPANGDVSLRAPSYEAAFRTFAVRVQLPDPWTGEAVRDAERLLGGIRAGHVYTVVDAIASNGWLELDAADRDRTAVAGDDLPAEGAVTLRARASQTPRSSLVLLRDGLPLVTTRDGGLVATHEPRSGVSIYRLEAYLDTGAGRTAVPWMVSNPIRVGSRQALAPPAAPTDPPIVALAALEEGAEWRQERDPRSRLSLEPAAAPWGDAGWLLTYTLADGPASGQYVAGVLGILRGRLQGWDALSFRAQAGAPMRLSVQLRDPATGGRWLRSAYVDGETRDIRIRFGEMTPMDGGGPVPSLEQVDSVLFVVDTTNTVPATAGRVWIGDVRVERTLPDQ